MNRPDSEVIGRIQAKLYEPAEETEHHPDCWARHNARLACACYELDRQDEEDADEERRKR